MWGSTKPTITDLKDGQEIELRVGEDCLIELKAPIMSRDEWMLTEPSPESVSVRLGRPSVGPGPIGGTGRQVLRLSPRRVGLYQLTLRYTNDPNAAAKEVLHLVLAVR